MFFLISICGGSSGSAQTSGGVRTWEHSKWGVMLAPPMGDRRHPLCMLVAREPKVISGDPGFGSFFVSYSYGDTGVAVSVDIVALAADAEKNKSLSVIVDGQNFGSAPLSWAGALHPNETPVIMAKVPIPPSEQKAFFAALEAGKTIDLKSKTHAWTVSLDGISQSLKDLFSCVELLPSTK